MIELSPQLRTISLKRRYCLKKLQFLVMRHPFPVNEKERLAFRHGPKIFANSIPKAGTNLIKKMLYSLDCVTPRWSYHLDRSIKGHLDQLYKTKNGQVLTSHIPWSEKLAATLKKNKFKILFMIRDIRDLAYSNVYYYTFRDSAHPLHRYFCRLPNDNERLTASILGVTADDADDGQHWGTIGERVQQYLGWIDEPSCLTIRFEDLIGKAGGGEDQKQHETVRCIIDHLELSFSEPEINDICQQTFSTKSRTFRKGHIRDWKNHFTENHKQLFKEVAGDILIQMGYENNYNW
jgi:hypothetical protein